MNARIFISVACLLTFGSATSSFAWPFVKKTTSAPFASGVRPQATAGDFDLDGRMDVYGGGK